MIDVLVYIAIFAIVAIVAWWILSQIPLPSPLKQILTIVVVLIGAIILVSLLLQFAGGGGFLPFRYR